MAKCTFCGKTYEAPKGLTLVKRDGSVRHLCSPKCRKNSEMGRKEVKWVKKRKETAKEKKAEAEAAAAEEQHETGEAEAEAAEAEK